MRKARSLYYARPVSANAFPAFTTEELLRDLCSPSLDVGTRAKIEAEITRRRAYSHER